ncbi:hypothetical protein M407DRAFT_9277 [Tulasnella calospora MUT 4182]|uniref:Uncharacterized protein n=1 Tax=Tulasnella calospora MUT 4182 TaxID=1051891 RepID=A0A0C3Q4A8_9AGAM|nr:hypothetical protein M407DRAFT_9277 [Tulasnella calospora MUT 4182]
MTRERRNTGLWAMVSLISTPGFEGNRYSPPCLFSDYRPWEQSRREFSISHGTSCTIPEAGMITSLSSLLSEVPGGPKHPIQEGPLRPGEGIGFLGPEGRFLDLEASSPS